MQISRGNFPQLENVTVYTAILLIGLHEHQMLSIIHHNNDAKSNKIL